MSFRIRVAQFPNGGFPENDARTPASDQTFPAGTPVTWDTAAQDLNEFAGGATVTNLLGFSYEGVESGVAENPSGKVNLALSSRSNIFMGKLVNGSGVVQTPDSANINVNYGILKVSTLMNQWWGVDEADTTDVVVEVIGIDTDIDDTGVVFFKVIESAIQQP